VIYLSHGFTNPVSNERALFGESLLTRGWAIEVGSLADGQGDQSPEVFQRELVVHDVEDVMTASLEMILIAGQERGTERARTRRLTHD
jgi:hypothetical protein